MKVNLYILLFILLVMTLALNSCDGEGQDADPVIPTVGDMYVLHQDAPVNMARLLLPHPEVFSLIEFDYGPPLFQIQPLSC